MSEIPEAEFYDCADSDRLTHTTPEEAVADWLDTHFEQGEPLGACIARVSPVELVAYRREEVADAWLAMHAESFLESAAESFSEEYGDPDGDGDELDDAAIQAALPDMIAALRKLCAEGTVWRCDRVAKVELDAETVERMMREHCPEWFEEEPAA